MKCPAIVKESTIYTSVFYKDIQQARKDTNTNPSEAQIKAENYKKGTFRWNGLVIKIENPKGSTRSGTSPDGKKWSIKMKYDYGYIGQTKGKDGDAVDIFIGDHPESQIVYVVDQTYNGKFDEHKCVIGALDEEEARKTYLANYEKGWSGLGSIKALTVEQFKEWVKSGNTRKAINKQELFKVASKYKEIFIDDIKINPTGKYSYTETAKIAINRYRKKNKYTGKIRVFDTQGWSFDSDKLDRYDIAGNLKKGDLMKCPMVIKKTIKGGIL